MLKSVKGYELRILIVRKFHLARSEEQFHLDLEITRYITSSIVLISLYDNEKYLSATVSLFVITVDRQILLIINWNLVPAVLGDY